MHDDLERTAESPSLSSTRPMPTRLEIVDARAALAMADAASGAKVFGQPDAALVTALLDDASQAASRGDRVSVVGRIEAFTDARGAMRRIAQAHTPLVAHAIAAHGSDELAGLADLGWGVLVASGPEDSFDLAMVARRATEDSGVPFVVVHALASPGRHVVSSVALPSERSCERFVGKTRAEGDASRPSLAGLTNRAFGERLPFALGSALRDFGGVSGRRHDVLERVPLAEAPLVLVGAGPLGDALRAAVPELRARGFDVGAVHLSALRPFPGPRLVKALGRALAVTVLEAADEPLGHGGMLARELKAAFTDAITWAPDFPGIGRIPKLFVGVTGASFDIADLAGICENMLADERGRRIFSLADVERSLPRGTLESAIVSTDRAVHVRWVLDDMAAAEDALGATVTLLQSAMGLRASGIVSAQGPGVVVDLTSSRDPARGVMARRGATVVVACAAAMSATETVAPLLSGSVLAVLGEGSLPDAARGIVRERAVRVVSLGRGAAAACIGASLAASTSNGRVLLDGGAVARAVGDLYGARGVDDAVGLGEAARRAFELTASGMKGG